MKAERLRTSKLEELFKEECARLDLSPTARFLCVSIPESKLYYFGKDGFEREYVISTSKKEPSCKENSLGTPWGMHKIADKIGEGEPLGMIFVAREPIGQCYQDCEKYPEGYENPITTRILRMKGLEEGLNQGEGCDTYDRYVYIHSTIREHLIGKPLSQGCILLKNEEIIELFNKLKEDDLVWIMR